MLEIRCHSQIDSPRDRTRCSTSQLKRRLCTSSKFPCPSASSIHPYTHPLLCEFRRSWTASVASFSQRFWRKRPKPCDAFRDISSCFFPCPYLGEFSTSICRFPGQTEHIIVFGIMSSKPSVSWSTYSDQFPSSKLLQRAGILGKTVPLCSSMKMFLLYLLPGITSNLLRRSIRSCDT